MSRIFQIKQKLVQCVSEFVHAIVIGTTLSSVPRSLGTLNTSSTTFKHHSIEDESKDEKRLSYYSSIFIKGSRKIHTENVNKFPAQPPKGECQRS